ncbi:MAG: ABC transporter permease [Bacteroidales bacterium]|nr:ABC transporter permease [Bacteroidales bacterium]MBQ5435433.1 ABC transporter permease [Bacteroidales bacterium]
MNWKKVGIVISHEYTTRVRKKSFILTTLLTPIGMALLICVPALIMLFSGNDNQKVKVIDESGIVAPYLENSEHTTYVMGTEGETVDLLREIFDDLDYYAIVGISPLDENGEVSVVSYSKEPLNMDLKNAISRAANKAVETRKLAQYDIRDLDEILSDVKTDIKVNSMTLTNDGDAKEDSVEIYMVLAYLMSFMIYMFVFMFGTMVMRSVIDEKSSRVVEVIVSSVKSVELMMGKIIGVALVALTQFFIWIALTLVIVTAVNAFAGPKLLQSMGGMEQAVAVAGQDGNIGTADVTSILEAAGSDPDASGFVKILGQIKDLNWGYLIGCFLIYFLLGYLLYASMFAAIGAAVDNEADTNQLQLPITIPLIIGLFIMLHTFEHPNSALSVWTSIIPWTSPMVMLARIPFGTVPGWQLLLSILLLLLTFLATAWLSAKIYKVGILTYGKKSSFKDLLKWMKLKD